MFYKKVSEHKHICRHLRLRGDNETVANAKSQQSNNNVKIFGDWLDSSILLYLVIKHLNLDNGRWHIILTQNGKRTLAGNKIILPSKILSPNQYWIVFLKN